MRQWGLVILLGLVTACVAPPSKETVFGISRDQLDALQLAYYSDYVSFVGWDQHGAVAFALDTNRGRDADTWQAEHFVVLHDETAGWQDVEGNGNYPNDAHQLASIPDSRVFSFEGRPEAGWRIQSDVNGLTLAVAPLQFHISRQQGLAEYRLGSGPATLSWQGRDLSGRVIYEFLFLPAFNRLSRTYSGVFNDFHGLYLSVDRVGDLYLHRQTGEGFIPLILPQEGFLALGDIGRPLQRIQVEIRGREAALGFYRWPTLWGATFSTGSQSFELRAHVLERETIANWLVGGFSMGIVRGTLRTPSGEKPVYGLGELII